MTAKTRLRREDPETAEMIENATLQDRILMLYYCKGLLAAADAEKTDGNEPKQTA